MSKKPSRSRFVLAVCVAFALLVHRPALAVQAPWALPAPLPDVGLGNPFSALRVSVFGSVSGFNVNPDPPFNVIPVLDSANDQKTDFGLSLVHQTTLAYDLQAPSETGLSTSTMVGVAGFGKLRAIASTSYTAGTNVAMFGSADAKVVVEFLDVITFDDNGRPSNNWEWSWPVNGSATEFRLLPPFASGGGSTARAQMWIFDYGPLPAPNRFTIDALAYGEARYFPNAAPFVSDTGGFNPDPGGAYWVYGRLEASSSTAVSLSFNLFNGGTAEADFSHTAELFLTPAADNPGATFTSVSGYNYAPLPEPSTLLLSAVGGVAVVGWRKRMMRRRS